MESVQLWPVFSMDEWPPCGAYQLTKAKVRQIFALPPRGAAGATLTPAPRRLSYCQVDEGKRRAPLEDRMPPPRRPAGPGEDRGTSVTAILRATLATGGRPHVLRAGELLWSQGDRADALRPAEQTGHSGEYRSSPLGQRAVLSLLRAPEVLGEVAVLDGRPRLSSVEAVTTSAVVYLSREVLVDAICAQRRGVPGGVRLELGAQVRQLAEQRTTSYLLDLPAGCRREARLRLAGGTTPAERPARTRPRWRRSSAAPAECRRGGGAVRPPRLAARGAGAVPTSSMPRRSAGGPACRRRTPGLAGSARRPRARARGGRRAPGGGTDTPPAARRAPYRRGLGGAARRAGPAGRPRARRARRRRRHRRLRRAAGRGRPPGDRGRRQPGRARRADPPGRRGRGRRPGHARCRATATRSPTWSSRPASTWCCATAVLEVVDDPAEVVAALAAALRPGGAASVLVASRAAAVLARAMNGHLDAAAALLADPRRPRRRRGTRCAAATTPTTAAALLAAAGLAVEEIHGVRVLADLVPGGGRRRPSRRRLLELELAAAGPAAVPGHRRPAAPVRPPAVTGRPSEPRGRAGRRRSDAGPRRGVRRRRQPGRRAAQRAGRARRARAPPTRSAWRRASPGYAGSPCCSSTGSAAHQLPVAAPYAPTLAEPRRPAAARARSPPASRPPPRPAWSRLGTGAPPGAHGVLGFTVNVPGTDRVLNHIDWSRRPGSAALAAGAPPSSSGPRRPGSRSTVVSRPEFAGSGLTVAAYRGGDYRRRGRRRRAGRRGCWPRWPRRRARRWSTATTPTWTGTGHLLRRRLAAVAGRRGRGGPAAGPAGRRAAAGRGAAGHRRPRPAQRAGRSTGSTWTPTRGCAPGYGWWPASRGCATCTSSPARVDDVLADLARRCSATRPGCVTREEAVARGLVRPGAARRTCARVGDVVVVCHDRYAVLATRTEPPLVAGWSRYHGSYTAAEMTVPLLVVRG